MHAQGTGRGFVYPVDNVVEDFTCDYCGETKMLITKMPMASVEEIGKVKFYLSKCDKCHKEKKELPEYRKAELVRTYKEDRLWLIDMGIVRV